MLFKDYIKLYKAHYMLIVECFYKIMKEEQLEKDEYVDIYVNFNQFVAHSDQARRISEQILTYNPSIL